MFGLSKNEKRQRSLDLICGIQLGLFREIRNILLERHPEQEVFLDTQPQSVTKLNYAAAAIAQFAWLMHAREKDDHQGILDAMHLAVLREVMRARNYDIPPQVAHRQYTDEFMDVWRYYRDYLDKILIEKNMNSIQTLYVVIEDEVLKYKGPEGRIGVAEASTKLLNIVTTALAFIKKNA